MHVLYDGRIYLTQPAGGINRYFANVIERLPATDRATVTLPRMPRVNFPTHPGLHTIVARDGRGAGLTRPLQLRAGVRGLDHDLLHPTYYRLLDHSSMRRSGVPVVLTVHDMVHERFADRMDRRGIRAEIKRRALRAADAIICVSGSTHDELLDLHPWLDTGRMHVVPHASEIGPHTPTDTSVVPERPYLLHVGSRFLYKDFPLLLEATQHLVQDDPDLALLVVGPPFDDAERSLIEGRGLGPHVVHLGVVDDAKLAALYAGARALAYPSRYEGFGIPPLEAMAMGTDVVAAEATSIPEVLGDAGLLFEPGSVEALTEQLRRTLDDGVERSARLERGRRRATEFSWDRTAQLTRDVYRSVL